jgi:hypothetical protein
MGLQPTASNTELLLGCQRPFDPALELPPRESSAKSNYGSAFHEAIAVELAELDSIGRAAGQRTYDLAAILDHWQVRVHVSDFKQHLEEAIAFLHRWMRGENPFGLRWQVADTEKSYAYHPRKDAVRPALPPDEENHIYPDLRPGEVGMTVDLELIAVGGAGDRCALDYKTGWVSKHASAAEVPQLKTIGLALKSKYVAAMETPRSGLPAIYAEELYVDDREKHRKELVRKMRRIGDGSLTPAKERCRYCHARSTCAAADHDLLVDSVAIVEAMGGVIERQDSGGNGLVAADIVGKLHLLFSRYDQLRERGRQEIRRFVEEHPDLIVVRPDGKMLEIVPKAVERISKTAILRAMGKIAGEKELERLREFGALESKVQMELRAQNDR